MIISAGNNETFSFATPIGVGLVESSINLTRLCLFDKPDFLVFVGSAGSYGNLNIFDIVCSTTASNIELSFLDNNSFTPIDNILEYKSKHFKNDTIINSSNYITTNIVKSKQFFKYNIEAENMEFFSVAKVANEFKIPFWGIFVITNYTDKNAHKDFLTNHQKAMQILINSLKVMHII